MNLLTVTISQMPARNLAIIHIHKCTPGIQRVENILRFEPGSPDNVEKSMLPTRQGWLNDYLLPRYYLLYTHQQPSFISHWHTPKYETRRRTNPPLDSRVTSFSALHSKTSEWTTRHILSSYWFLGDGSFCLF